MMSRIPWAALFAATSVVAFTGAAQASHGIDTGDVTLPASTRAIEVEVLGVTVSLDKFSDPTFRVAITPTAATPELTQRTFRAGQNRCAADDVPAAGTFNRTISARTQLAAAATAYLKVEYTQTTAAGQATRYRLEPMGSYPGQTLTLPVSLSGDEVQLARLCVS